MKKDDCVADDDKENGDGDDADDDYSNSEYDGVDDDDDGKEDYEDGDDDGKEDYEDGDDDGKEEKEDVGDMNDVGYDEMILTVIMNDVNDLKDTGNISTREYAGQHQQQPLLAQGKKPSTSTSLGLNTHNKSTTDRETNQPINGRS